MLVSVILPVRDRPARLAAAVQSVLAQSHANWELLLVDDGSAEPVRLRDGWPSEKIRLFRTPRVGASRARNVALAASRGDVVAYIDSDNEWEPDYLARVAPLYERPDVTAVYTGQKIKSKPGAAKPRTPFDWEALLQKNYIDLGVYTHRKALFDEHGGFDERLTRLVAGPNVRLIRKVSYGEPAALRVLAQLDVHIEVEAGVGEAQGCLLRLLVVPVARVAFFDLAQ